MSNEKLLFLGTIASSITLNNVDISSKFIAVEDGKITKIGSQEEFYILCKEGAMSDVRVISLHPSHMLIPGFVDCHTHAPQFPNIGLGLDKPLLEWLGNYTFPLEKKYGNVKFAAEIYDQVVKRLLNNGTTTSCYFGSLHLDSTLELVKSAIKHKQRALIGKVSMNIPNDADYFNDTKKELEEVESFVKQVLEYKNDLVQPVVTPRFALSCDSELMLGLTRIAETYGCRTQSHISENLKEIECVLAANPDCTTYGGVYDKSDILNNKCIMAHAIHLTDEEIELLSARDVSIAHCPASNTRLKSGLCPVRKYLNRSLKIGLGTDVSGGDSASILDAMRRSMDVSTHLELLGEEGAGLNWKEAFYLATLGGAKALNLDDKIGNFEVGKEFDALVVDPFAKNGPIDEYPSVNHDKDKGRHALHLMERFIYLGDDRNILQVYVKGKVVKDLLNFKG